MRSTCPPPAGPGAVLPVLAVLAGASLLVAGCGAEREPVAAPDEPGEPGEPAAAARPVREPDTSDEPPADDLAALGYVDFAEPADPDEEDGVVLRDAARSAPGYDLYVSIPFATAALLDAEGREVRRWRDAEALRWLRCELLPDGDVLVLGVPRSAGPDEPKGYVERRSWDGEVRWRRALPSHHDLDWHPDAGILVLALERRELPRNANWPALFDNGVVRLSADGAVREARSLTSLLGLEHELRDLSVDATLETLPEEEALALTEVLAEVEAWRAAQDEPAAEPTPAPPASPTPERPVDLIHANAVEWIGGRAADGPLAGADVLVTLRHLDQVAAFGWEDGRTRWRWGAEVLQGPHEASLLASGNVLVFDNGIRGRGHSRLVEVDPRSGEIVWQWSAPEPADFYCRTRGTCQALANGNVLVADSEKGVAFEVTRAGDVVWRFRAPEKDDEGRRGAIRARRYAPELVEPLLR